MAETAPDLKLRASRRASICQVPAKVLPMNHRSLNIELLIGVVREATPNLSLISRPCSGISNVNAQLGSRVLERLAGPQPGCVVLITVLDYNIRSFPSVGRGETHGRVLVRRNGVGSSSSRTGERGGEEGNKGKESGGVGKGRHDRWQTDEYQPRL